MGHKMSHTIATNVGQYLSHREGVPYSEQVVDVMATEHRKGVRTFFGIQLDEDGKMVSDAQEPTPGFLAAYDKNEGVTHFTIHDDIPLPPEYVRRLN